MNLLHLVLVTASAAEASADADEAQQHHAVGGVTDIELLLALSQARVECRRVMEMMATRIGELEVAARLVEQKAAA